MNILDKRSPMELTRHDLEGASLEQIAIIEPILRKRRGSTCDQVLALLEAILLGNDQCQSLALSSQSKLTLDNSVTGQGFLQVNLID